MRQRDSRPRNLRVGLLDLELERVEQVGRKVRQVWDRREADLDSRRLEEEADWEGRDHLVLEQEPTVGAPSRSQCRVPPALGEADADYGNHVDSSDFPALGAAPTHASQSQAPQPPATTSNHHHLSPHQMYMQGAPGLPPPPPPGMGLSPGQQPNGLSGDLRGEDFPALGAPGEGKERVCQASYASQISLIVPVVDGRIPADGTTTFPTNTERRFHIPLNFRYTLHESSNGELRDWHDRLYMVKNKSENE